MKRLSLIIALILLFVSPYCSEALNRPIAYGTVTNPNTAATYKIYYLGD